MFSKLGFVSALLPTLTILFFVYVDKEDGSVEPEVYINPITYDEFEFYSSIMLSSSYDLILCFTHSLSVSVWLY